jgi:hypothetical protein
MFIGIARMCIFLPALATTFSACAHHSAPLPQDVYVWQRQWTPAVQAALTDAQDIFGAYHVLAAESNRSGTLIPVMPNLSALAHSQRPVTAVLRLNGSDPSIDPKMLGTRIHALIDDWRDAGIFLVGVEIDHDCATARLSDYARLLVALRAGWPSNVKLSITVLPAWIDAPALPDLLATVDESVLQVHAVQAPGIGLFDSALARRWIDEYTARVSQPFRVALPDFGLRVGFDEAGSAVAAEAEMPRAIDAVDVRELRVAPQDVARLLRSLEHAHPPQLEGIVWFRLPTTSDYRAWSMATLRAVITDKSLQTQLSVRVDGASGGVRDVVLTNVGAVDAQLPAAVVLRARGCVAADALAGFRLDARTDGWRFLATADGMLRAGRERRMGWVRCEFVEKVNIDGTP